MNVCDKGCIVTHAQPTGVKERNEWIFLLVVFIFPTNKKKSKEVNLRKQYVFLI